MSVIISLPIFSLGGNYHVTSFIHLTHSSLGVHALHFPKRSLKRVPSPKNKLACCDCSKWQW